MELKAQTLAQWSTTQMPDALRPDAARAVLLFGPDQGGVFEFGRIAAGSGPRERMDARSFDPGDAISALSSGSLFGGATTVILDGATDAQAGKIDTLLDSPFADGARLIILAGDLKANAKLRKRFQAGKDLVSAPLYLMRDGELQSFAANCLKGLGLKIDRAMLRSLGERLSGDRALATRACEVLALHAQGKGRDSITLDDIRAVLDTVDEASLSAPLDAALGGQAGSASARLFEKLAGGESFVALLRIFTHRLFRLREICASGLSPSEAVAKAKPPVFWSERDMTIRLVGSLTVAKLDRMIEMMDRAEYQIIEQGCPEAPVLGLLLLQISQHKNWK